MKFSLVLLTIIEIALALITIPVAYSAWTAGGIGTGIIVMIMMGCVFALVTAIIIDLWRNTP